jgi:splicing factor 3A subunit 1
LDIIKLTALFSARNGKQFITGLSQREHRNYQFDFLRPNHQLYAFYMKMTEQYLRVLSPPKDIKLVLETKYKSKTNLLKRITQRVTYRAYLEEEDERTKDEAEDEKIAFSTIDWHDFVIADTIEFYQTDETASLPPPMSVMDLQRMTIEQKRSIFSFADPKPIVPTPTPVAPTPAVIPKTVKSVSQPEETPVLPGLPSNIRIRTDYVPKFGKSSANETTQKCTICGAMVKASEMADHVRIELLDPKWREQRKALEAKYKDSNLIEGGSLDIFFYSRCRKEFKSVISYTK